jgi:phosphate/sulfate permease
MGKRFGAFANYQFTVHPHAVRLRARRRGRTLIAGRRGPQPQGVRVASVCNLALAWVLTLPMAMILSGLLFAIFRQSF